MVLYKYVTFDRIDILKNELIRFTQPIAFNDPFELFPFFQSIAPHKEIEEMIDNRICDEEEIYEMLEESWNNELKKRPGFNIPFSVVKDLVRSNYEQLKPLVIKVIRNYMGMKGTPFRKMAIDSVLEAINKSIGILCLSETPDNILMWSHYSENHTGLVFELDDSHVFFSQKQSENKLPGHVRKVRYSRYRPKLTLLNPSLSDEEHTRTWIEDFLWAKSSNWEYEKEWRMIQTFRDWKGVVKDAEPPIYLYPIPIGCIKGIIVGCRTEIENLALLKDLLKSDAKFSHIVLKKAVIDEEQYKLNVIDIKM